MLHGANFDKMLEVDPESCAQAFKGSSSVNHAPPMAEDKASTQGPGALAGLKVIDLTLALDNVTTRQSGCRATEQDAVPPASGRVQRPPQALATFQRKNSRSKSLI